VVLSERWSSRADLDAHIGALKARGAADADAGATRLTPLSREVHFLEASPFEVT
jgi:hypothetical protein